MASSDSTAPFGLPGRLMMMVVARMAATARDMIARGVFLIFGAHLFGKTRD